jgi:hypothetical protein
MLGEKVWTVLNVRLLFSVGSCVDNSGLFSFVEVEQRKKLKKRKSLDDSISTVNSFIGRYDEDGFKIPKIEASTDVSTISVSFLESTKENIVNSSQTSNSSHLLELTQPLEDTLLVKTESVNSTVLIEEENDFDFHLTEDDLKRIDEEITGKLSVSFRILLFFYS